MDDGFAGVVADLPARWREQAEQLRPYIGGVAAAFETCATQLERALHDSAYELLTLTQASAEGGYSVEHLSRMVKAGSIPNAGRPRAPRIRRGAVPHKPGHQTRPGEPLAQRRRTSQFAKVRSAVFTSKGGR